jgi:hypothetical protein
MIDREILLLIVGAAIALVSSIFTAIVNHLLSLRADRILRERTAREKKVAERKADLQFSKKPSALENAIRINPIFHSVGIEETAMEEIDTKDTWGDSAEEQEKPPRINLTNKPTPIKDQQTTTGSDD